MPDLTHFGLPAMIDAGRRLRKAAEGARSLQHAADCVAQLLYQEFCDPETRQPQCALIRCFKTHPLAGLPAPLQASARALLPESDPPPAMRCLTLLATRGLRPEWNSPQTSHAHRVIPLPSAEFIARAPMIARLIAQIGLSVEDLLSPEPGFLIDSDSRTFNVFHVEEARGSQFVPAQDTFVRPANIRSVLGFGGVLPSPTLPAEFFAVVLFTRVPVSREAAALFRTLALSVKIAFLPFSSGHVFAEDQPV